MSVVGIYISVAVGVGTLVGCIGWAAGLSPVAAIASGILSAIGVFLSLSMCYVSGEWTSTEVDR